MPVFLLVAIAAGVVGWIVGLLTSRINTRLGNVLMFVASTAIGMYYYNAFWTIFAVATAPLWILFLVVLVVGVLYKALVKRGYFGNHAKWESEIDPDAQFQAATLLLGPDRVEEVAELSTDADDYYNNIIQAAGLHEHDVPGP